MLVLKVRKQSIVENETEDSTNS